MCSIENCELENFENNDKCILHCDKNNWYADDNEERIWNNKEYIKLFWKKIKNIMETSELAYCFKSIIFPKFVKKSLAISDLEGTFYFNEQSFDKNVYFRDCIFLDDVYFESTNFKKILQFDGNTKFEKSLDFSKATFFQGVFINIKNEYEIKKLFLDHATFESLLEIKNQKVKSINLYNSRFKKFVDFENTHFYKVLFKNTVFENKVSYRDTKFKEAIDFSYVTFKDNVIFNDASFFKELSIKDCIFEMSVSFLGIKHDNNLKLKDRETARKIKDSFEQQNNIIEANKFYALEMKEREKELNEDRKKGKNIFEWLVFKFHGISSNHSQNWLLALFWILVIGMLSSTIDFFYFSNEPCIVYDFSITNLALVYTGIFIFYYLIATYFDGNYFKTTLSLFAIVPIYWYLTRDFLFCSFSKTINPFSIMKSAEDINIIQLFFKIIIAYLIYQLIISIRQNTRRK